MRPEELLALREQDIDAEQQLILVHQRAVPGGGRPDKPGVLKPGLKERRRLVREEPRIRGRWALFPQVLHPGRAGTAIATPGEENVVQLARSEFLYVTGTHARIARASSSPSTRSGRARSGRSATCTATSSCRRARKPA